MTPYLDALAAWLQTADADWPMTQLIWTGTATAQGVSQTPRGEEKDENR